MNSDSTIRSVTVSLDTRSYDIVIGQSLLADASRFIAPVLRTPRVVVIADAHAWKLHGAPLQASLITHGIHVDMLPITGGEASKSFEMLEQLMNNLLALNIDRSTTIIAFGGGVIGDLAGFVASIALRGIPFIQVPTTLLAQVDSSVGGKTAINAPKGKNLIGTFYQPQLVLIDSDTLATLPARHLRAGYAEIIKYGLIRDVEFYRWCLRHGEQILGGDSAYLVRAIEASCAMKASIVSADERESGVRATLNFGHTFGHALEAELGYSDDLYHGEAVAIGMVMACHLSEKLGYIPPEIREELTQHLKAVGFATSLYDTGKLWNIENVISHMYSDKKAENAALNFITLKHLGEAIFEKNVNAELVHAILTDSQRPS